MEHIQPNELNTIKKDLKLFRNVFFFLSNSVRYFQTFRKTHPNARHVVDHLPTLFRSVEDRVREYDNIVHRYDTKSWKKLLRVWRLDCLKDLFRAQGWTDPYMWVFIDRKTLQGLGVDKPTAVAFVNNANAFIRSLWEIDTVVEVWSQIKRTWFEAVILDVTEQNGQVWLTLGYEDGTSNRLRRSSKLIRHTGKKTTEKWCFGMKPCEEDAEQEMQETISALKAVIERLREEVSDLKFKNEELARDNEDMQAVLTEHLETFEKYGADPELIISCEERAQAAEMKIDYLIESHECEIEELKKQASQEIEAVKKLLKAKDELLKEELLRLPMSPKELNLATKSSAFFRQDTRERSQAVSGKENETLSLHLHRSSSEGSTHSEKDEYGGDYTDGWGNAAFHSGWTSPSSKSCPETPFFAEALAETDMELTTPSKQFLACEFERFRSLHASASPRLSEQSLTDFFSKGYPDSPELNIKKGVELISQRLGENGKITLEKLIKFYEDSYAVDPHGVAEELRRRGYKGDPARNRGYSSSPEFGEPGLMKQQADSSSRDGVDSQEDEFSLEDNFLRFASVSSQYNSDSDSEFYGPGDCIETMENGQEPYDSNFDTISRMKETLERERNKSKSLVNQLQFDLACLETELDCQIDPEPEFKKRPRSMSLGGATSY